MLNYINKGPAEFRKIEGASALISERKTGVHYQAEVYIFQDRIYAKVVGKFYSIRKDGATSSPKLIVRSIFSGNEKFTSDKLGNLISASSKANILEATE